MDELLYLFLLGFADVLFLFCFRQTTGRLRRQGGCGGLLGYCNYGGVGSSVYGLLNLNRNYLENQRTEIRCPSIYSITIQLILSYNLWNHTSDGPAAC